MSGNGTKVGHALLKETQELEGQVKTLRSRLNSVELLKTSRKKRLQIYQSEKISLRRRLGHLGSVDLNNLEDSVRQKKEKLRTLERNKLSLSPRPIKSLKTGAVLSTSIKEYRFFTQKIQEIQNEVKLTRQKQAQYKAKIADRLVEYQQLTEFQRTGIESSGLQPHLNSENLHSQKKLEVLKHSHSSTVKRLQGTIEELKDQLTLFKQQETSLQSKVLRKKQQSLMLDLVHTENLQPNPEITGLPLAYLLKPTLNHLY